MNWYNIVKQSIAILRRIDLFPPHLVNEEEKWEVIELYDWIIG